MKYVQRSNVFISLVIGFVCALLHSSMVSAQNYMEGVSVQGYGLCPVSGGGGSSTVTGYRAWVGFQTDMATTPKLGETVYVHGVVGSVNPCVPELVSMEFFFPEGTLFAITPNTPIICKRIKVATNSEQDIPPGDQNGACYQTPQAGEAGGSKFGWSSLPAGWALDIRIPVIFTTELRGMSGPPGHRLVMRTTNRYVPPPNDPNYNPNYTGILFPQIYVTAFYQTKFFNYAASGVSNTSAALAYDLFNFHIGGQLDVEFGTSSTLGTSLGATTINDDTSSDYGRPISLDINGLSPNTRYYWRPRYVTRKGTFIGAVQSFVTTGGSPALNLAAVKSRKTH